MEALDPELCTRIRTEWYMTSKKDPLAKISTHYTLNRLVRGQRALCEFFKVNLETVAIVLQRSEARYTTPTRPRHATFEEAVAHMKRDASAGYPYFCTKELALVRDFDTIQRQTLAIVAGADPGPMFGWVTKKVEVLDAKKRPHLMEEECISPGKERNVIVEPLPVVLAFYMLCGPAIEAANQNWTTTTTKVGSGKIDLPQMWLTMRREGYVYRSYDISGQEMNLHPDWYLVPAHLRAAQSGLPVSFWVDFYRKYVTSLPVVCDCGNVYQFHGGNRSGFPDTVGSNSEITKALLCMLTYATEKRISPGAKLLVSLQEWEEWWEQLSMAVVGDDCVVGLPAERVQTLILAAEVSGKYSTLKLKIETSEDDIVDQVFLSCRYDVDKHRVVTVRPRKLLASLYFSEGPADILMQKITSSYIDLVDTEYSDFISRLLVAARAERWPEQFYVDRKFADICNTPEFKLSRVRPHAVLKPTGPHKLLPQSGLMEKAIVKKAAKKAAKKVEKRVAAPKAVKPTRVPRQVARGPVKGDPFAKDHAIDDSNAMAWADAICNPRLAGGRVPDGRCMLPTSTGQLFKINTWTSVTDISVTSNAYSAYVICADPLIQIAQLSSANGATFFWGNMSQIAPVTTLTANTSFYRAVSCGIRIIPTSPVLYRQGVLKINEIVTGLTYGTAPSISPSTLDSQPTMTVLDAAKLPDEGVEVFWRPATGGSPIETQLATGTPARAATSWTYSANNSSVYVVDTSLVVRWEGSSTNPMTFQVEFYWNYEAIPLYSIAQPEVKTLGGGAQLLSDAIRHTSALQTPVSQKVSQTAGTNVGDSILKGVGSFAKGFVGGFMRTAMANGLAGRVFQKGLSWAASAFLGGKGSLFSADLERAHAVAVLSGRDRTDPLYHHPHTQEVLSGAAPGRSVHFVEFNFDKWMTAFVDRRNSEDQVALAGYGGEKPTVACMRRQLEFLGRQLHEEQKTLPNPVAGPEECGDDGDSAGDGVFLDDGTVIATDLTKSQAQLAGHLADVVQRQVVQKLTRLL